MKWRMKMGTVAGPFSVDDWYTMKMLKEDLAYLKKHSKDKPDYVFAVKQTEDLLAEYLQKQAA
jgi:hypothetical protein